MEINIRFVVCVVVVLLFFYLLFGDKCQTIKENLPNTNVSDISMPNAIDQKSDENKTLIKILEQQDQQEKKIQDLQDQMRQLYDQLHQMQQKIHQI
jgi:hypothetical protein